MVLTEGSSKLHNHTNSHWLCGRRNTGTTVENTLMWRVNKLKKAAGLSSLEGESLLLADGERGDLRESKGVELGVELEVNCHTRVNLVISSGMDRGFFTTIPTATGSVGGETQNYYVSSASCF